jgi:hypothetical protein
MRSLHIFKDVWVLSLLVKKYLANRHLVKTICPKDIWSKSIYDRQSVKNVLADKHFIKKYLTNRHLDKKYDQQTFGQKLFNCNKGIEMRQLAFRSADVYCQNINNPKCPLTLFLYANGKKGETGRQ